MSRSEFVPQQSRALISRTTILILASLLLWVGAGRELAQRQNAVYLLLGTLGMGAYLALERAAYRRLHREYSNTKALYRLEQRLHAQQEDWFEALGVDHGGLPYSFPGLTFGAARVAESANGRARSARPAWNGSADVRTDKTAPDDTFLNTPTTRASLA